MSEPQVAPAEGVHFAEIYDLSLDIERWDADVEFADGNGTIRYIFDQNIFELFVYPYNHCNQFDSRPKDPKRLRPSGNTPLSLESAVLAAEALFSGSLPGQSSAGEIYLTEWHRWELLDRLSTIISECGDLSAGDSFAVGREVVHRKFEYWEKSGNLAAVLQRVDDPDVRADVERLRKSRPIDEATLLSFVGTRELALLLSEERNVEPMQQLQRIIAPKMQARLKGLVSLKRPGSDDLKGLSERTQFWTRELSREISSRGRILRPRLSRFNDGASLAMIEWISGQLNPGTDRIVFVTGDEILFDTYRRNYYRRDAHRRPGPFLLRRPRQYTPIFMNDSDPVADRQSQSVLYSVQQAVEIALVAPRLLAISERLAFRARLDRKHALTLPPIAPPGGDSELDLFWKRHQTEFKHQRLADVDAELAYTERTVIGMSRNRLLQRLSPEEIKIFQDAAGVWKDEQDEAFRSHLERLTQNLVDSAITIWQPIAERVFARNIENHELQIEARAPVALKLAVAGQDGVSIDLMGLLDAGRLRALREPEPVNDGPPPRSFLNSAFDLFMAASVLALLSEQWRFADHFCSMAIRSVEFFESQSAADRANNASEAYFLSAISKRFRMGELHVGLTSDAYEQAKRLFDAATEAMKKHTDHANLDPTDRRHRPFFEVRARSEQAAASLFLAEIAWATSKSTDGTERSKEIWAVAKEALLRAGDCLEACIRIQESSPADRLHLHSEDDAHRLIQVQILVNIAAYYALGDLVFGPDGNFRRPALESELESQLEALVAFMGNSAEPLFREEIAVFKKLRGDPAPLVFSTSPTEHALAIDLRLSEALRVRWSETAAGTSN